MESVSSPLHARRASADVVLVPLPTHRATRAPLSRASSFVCRSCVARSRGSSKEMPSTCASPSIQHRRLLLHPHSPCSAQQRNTNALLRQYFPNRHLSVYTRADLASVQATNTLPTTL